MSCVYKQRMGLLTFLTPLIYALHKKLNPRQGIYSYRLLILLSVAGHLSANKVLFGVHLQHSHVNNNSKIVIVYRKFNI